MPTWAFSESESVEVCNDDDDDNDEWRGFLRLYQANFPKGQTWFRSDSENLVELGAEDILVLRECCDLHFERGRIQIGIWWTTHSPVHDQC